MNSGSEVPAGWKKETLQLLRSQWAPHQVFGLGDVYRFADILAAKYPDNQHVEEKIRQTLQLLRDDGDLKFEDEEGQYSLKHPIPFPNDPVLREMDESLRAQLLNIRDIYGQTLASDRLQTMIKGFGSQKGIYKPSGSTHALWVRQTSKGDYPDKEPAYLPDGSWTYRYSPEGRDGKTDLNLDTNKGLLQCQTDRVPIGVFRQTELMSGKSAYEVLGLAYVDSFDGTHFVLRGESIDVSSQVPFEEVATNFSMFQSDLTKLAPSLRIVRDQRFGVAIRKLYHGRCSLCSIGYRVAGRMIGLDAAHIIPVENNGVIGNVRNGILLCKNHHALFDQFAWTLDDQLNVIVAKDKDFRLSAVGNHVLGWEAKRLQNLPDNSSDLPAPEAIEWRLNAFNAAWSA
jgi:hypothetical protein